MNRKSCINRPKTINIDEVGNLQTITSCEGFFLVAHERSCNNDNLNSSYSEKNSVAQATQESYGPVLVERLGRNPELVEFYDTGFIREDIDLLEFALGLDDVHQTLDVEVFQ